MRSLLPLTVIALASAAPAHAALAEQADTGFVVRHATDVPADIATAWKELVAPAGWWDSRHTFSGSAANLTIDPRPGGCFCEVLPDADNAQGAPRGGVEHMRVINVERNRVLRMSGALGPLQSEAMQGTLTIVLKPLPEGGTRVLWEYVVGGYMRLSVEKIGPAVDGVLGEQAVRLSRKLGALPPAEAAPVPAPTAPSGPPESGR